MKGTFLEGSFSAHLTLEYLMISNKITYQLILQ